MLNRTCLPTLVPLLITWPCAKISKFIHVLINHNFGLFDKKGEVIYR